MAGHSQGGAVMQLFTYRAMEKGLLPRYALGYGFASPSVLYDHPGRDLCAYPLFHLINADDVTPRVGASLHIGQCMVFTPDESMRRVCYRAGWDNPAFLPLLHYLHAIRDSASAFLAMLGFLHALERQPDAETAALLPSVLSRILPEKWVLSLGGRVDSFLRPFIHQTEKGYRAASGLDAPPPELLEPLIRRCDDLMRRYGAKTCVQALGTALGLPHKLRGPMDEMRSYQFIVNARLNDLLQRVWLPPVMVSEGLPRGGERRNPGNRFARYSGEKNRRIQKRFHS